MMRGRSVSAAVMLALVFAVDAIAQEYSFRLYGAAEGLQNMVILSLAQDRDGYIWIGSEGGLYRYDGTRFHLIGPAEGLPCATEIHTLYLAADGALWTNACNQIFRFDGQTFHSVPGLAGPLAGARRIAEDVHGHVVVSTTAGLQEVLPASGGTFVLRAYPLTAALEGKPMHGILRHGSQLWFGCDRHLCVEDGGRTSIFGPESGLPEDSWDGIAVSRDGAVWARSPSRLSYKPPGKAHMIQEKPDIGSSMSWGAVTITRDGSVMVPTDRGLAIHTAAGWSVVNRQRGLRNDMTGAVMEDREGSVWIGLIGGGVARWLGRGDWESWKVDQGLPSDLIWSIRRDRKGALWVGTSLGLTRLDGSGRTRTWTRKDGLGGDNVRWLAETSDGSIWAAMKPGGLARIDSATGKIRLAGQTDGLPCSPEDVFVDRRDRLWVPTACGLFRNDRPSVSNRFIRVETPESLGHGAWKVLEDANGTVWVTNREGLWGLREGQWHHFRHADGLLSDNPYVMALAADGSIWLRHRYDAGVERVAFSGDRIVSATAVVPADAKSVELTAFHGFDAMGNFWRGSANGVGVRHGDTWTKFTTENGLVWNDCDGEAFWADADGGVWLGTSAGLAHYHPGNGGLPGPLVAYPTIARLEIVEPARLIRAEFSSLNYKAEQLVRFAYRLDDAPWTDSEERNISIAGLGPGRHRLEVRCRVRDGPFSPGIAAAEFRVEPMWRETWWARLLALACGVAAIIQFVRWRLSAAARRQAELEATVASRTEKLSMSNRALDEKARQLQISEERLKTAERLAHVGSWEWDIKTDRLVWSEEICHIFGRPENYTTDYAGFLAAVQPYDRERVGQCVRDRVAGKSANILEFEITRPDGDVRTLSSIAEVVRDERGLPVRMSGAWQDITDQKRAEAALRRSLDEMAHLNRVAAMGELATSLAHELNQPLAAILMNSQAASRFLGGKPPNLARVCDCLNAITADDERAAEVIKRLRGLLKKEESQASLVYVNEVVSDALRLVGNDALLRQVSVKFEPFPGLPPVLGDRIQLYQVVLNLIVNGLDAVAERPPGDRWVLVRTAEADGGCVELKVEDSGKGIAERDLTRVFEPFFSTKREGLGMGLSISRSIVEAHSGRIWTERSAGRGAIFRCLLPIAQEATAASAK